MSRRDPYQRDNFHGSGVFPSSLNSSNADTVQIVHLMSLEMVIEGLPVRTRRFSHPFEAATIFW
jgi:hypothetical protein